MLVTSIHETTLLYDTLSELGAIATEEHRIKAARSIYEESMHFTVRLSYEDVTYVDYDNGLQHRRVSFPYPHFCSIETNLWTSWNCGSEIAISTSRA